jgi:hypothetical protein
MELINLSMQITTFKLHSNLTASIGTQDRVDKRNVYKQRVTCGRPKGLQLHSKHIIIGIQPTCYQLHRLQRQMTR